MKQVEVRVRDRVPEQRQMADEDQRHDQARDELHENERQWRAGDVATVAAVHPEGLDAKEQQRHDCKRSSSREQEVERRCEQQGKQRGGIGHTREHGGIRPVSW